ncbi:MAG TPA: type II CAAX endopeptidase family protein [Roseiflexaceae bacterium]|nr:type II CAAX endopeptidase family protein [Roseiflexaceae bacterium]
MAQYDTQYTTIPDSAPPSPTGTQRRHWPLAAVFWIDLAIIFVLIILMNLALGGYALARALQEGLITTLNEASIRQVLADEATISRLLGPGIFVFVFIQNLVFLGVPILRVAVLRHEPLAEIGFRAERPLRLIGLGIGVGFAILVGNVVLDSFFTWLGIKQDQAEQFAEQFSLLQQGALGQALFFVFGAIAAPLSEEVLFRGYGFNALRQTLPSERGGLLLAYLGSALLFTLPHALAVTQGAIALLLPLFLIGLALAWLMHYTGSLLPCVIAHAMNNTFGLLALLFCLNNPGITACPKF